MLTMVGGVVLAIPLALAAAVNTAMYGAYTVNSDWFRRVLQDWVNLAVPLVGVALIPALLTGWLRLKPTRWLLIYCQRLPACRRRGVGLLGTCILFELCVVAAALFGWALGRGEAGSLGGWYVLCTAISLPWLLASLWATWRVLRPAGEAA